MGRWVAVVGVFVVLLLAACSGDDGATSGTERPVEPIELPPLEVARGGEAIAEVAFPGTTEEVGGSGPEGIAVTASPLKSGAVISVAVDLPVEAGEYPIEVTGTYCFDEECGSTENVEAALPVVVVEGSDAARLGVSSPAPDRVVTSDAGVGSVENELIVYVEAAPELAEVEALAASVGAVIVGSSEALGFWQLAFASTEAMESGRADLEQSGLVRAVTGHSVEPNPLEEVIPTDWDNDGSEATWSYEMIDAPTAWETSKGDGVRVGVVDAGIYPHHEDLSFDDNVENYRWIYAPWADAGIHGSHVAGTVCAAENGLGLIGVAPQCHLQALDIGRPSNWSASYLVERIDRFVRETQPVVVNLSFGFKVPCDDPDPVATKAQLSGASAAFDALFRSHPEVVWVAAAGNCGHDTSLAFPAALGEFHENVITVASAAPGGGITSYSNFGRAVDIVAPGGTADDPVWSLAHECDGIESCDSTYDTLNGTSQAAPHVTGTIALVAAAHPDKSAVELVECVTSTVDGANLLLDAAAAVACLPDLTIDDMMNARLPDDTCDGITAVEPPKQLVDGSVPGIPEAQGFIRTEPEMIALGDIDGDGADDAAMTVYCNAGGNSFYSSVRVYLADGGYVDAVPYGDVELGDGGWEAVVADVEITNDLIWLDWYASASSDARCCPSIDVRAAFFLADGRVHPTNGTDRAGVDASTPISLRGIGPIEAGMTLDEAEQASNLGFRIFGFDREDPLSSECFHVTVPGMDDLNFLVQAPGVGPPDDPRDAVIGRVTVYEGDRETISGIAIGSSTSEVLDTYSGSIVREPHEYVLDGEYLFFVPSETEGGFRVKFETSGDDEVTAIHAGALPSVAYVEGCL